MSSENSDLGDLTNSVAVTNIDLNAIVQNGLIRYSYADAANISNAPTADATVVYTRRYAGWVQQYAITQSAKLFIRATWDNNGQYSWSNWAEK